MIRASEAKQLLKLLWILLHGGVQVLPKPELDLGVEVPQMISVLLVELVVENLLNCICTVLSRDTQD